MTATYQTFPSPWKTGAANSQAIHRETVLKRLEWLSRLMDDAVQIPGTRISLGWDSLVGLVPFVGDAATTLVSAYFIWEASRIGASRWALVKMLGNVAVDFLVGTVPVIGDLFDVAWKANRRNLRLLQRELQKTVG